MNFDDFRKPFPAADIEWRVQRSGEKNGKIWAMVLAYVTNRAIMERLDEVAKPQKWKNHFRTGPGGGVLCGISIFSDTEWITKWDGAENTNFEAIKGGLSASMKRAAVQWGIGRYLYNLEATFADIQGNGKYSDKLKDGKWFKWNPPELPAWALPEGTPASNKQEKNSAAKKSPDTPDGEMSKAQWGFIEKCGKDESLSKDETIELVKWVAKTLNVEPRHWKVAKALLPAEAFQAQVEKYSEFRNESTEDNGIPY